MVGSVVASLQRMTWARRLESELNFYYLKASASLEEAAEEGLYIVADEGN